MDLVVPHELFINNQFVPSVSGKTDSVICPADESELCRISFAQTDDVDIAVRAAKEAFEHGEWSRMNPRDRGVLMHKLADLMEIHKEELASIESLDSGAVYTLALKTHVGMSIDTWRELDLPSCLLRNSSRGLCFQDILPDGQTKSRGILFR